MSKVYCKREEGECPACGSINTIHVFGTFEDYEECQDCGSAWQDIIKVIGYEDLVMSEYAKNKLKQERILEKDLSFFNS